MKYEVGDYVEDIPLITISGIKDIVPVKWDGIHEYYVVSDPAKADGFMITTQDGERIMITSDCTNKETLIDIV